MAHPRRHRHFKSPSWIWSIRLGISRAGAADTFEAARDDFQTAWKAAVSSTRVAADLATASVTEPPAVCHHPLPVALPDQSRGAELRASPRLAFVLYRKYEEIDSC
jgi:hypothetical protein